MGISRDVPFWYSSYAGHSLAIIGHSEALSIGVAGWGTGGERSPRTWTSTSRGGSRIVAAGGSRIRATAESAVDAVDGAAKALRQWTRGVTLSTQASPASVSEVTWSAGVVPPRRAYISFGLTDVAALGVDLSGAGILPGEAATFDLGTDGPSSLTLIGLRVGSRILVDGVRAAMVGPDARAVVMVTAGAHRVSVR